MDAWVARVRLEEKPATASLLARAYRAERRPGSVVAFFDVSDQNIIPMLQADHHLKILVRQASQLLGEKVNLYFEIGNDPSIAKAREQKDAALEFVTSDPKVRYALDVFKGKIVKCQSLEEEREEERKDDNRG